MRVMTAGLLAAAVVCSSPGGMPRAQQPSAPASDARPAGEGLSDLAAITFSCPRAGLNAAARQAAAVPSQGTYQFSYFAIVSDSHHAMYEVHFKSNYAGEPDLKYCVTVYCQQGWDPNAKASATLMSSQPERKGRPPHVAACSHPAPASPRSKK